MPLPPLDSLAPLLMMRGANALLRREPWARNQLSPHAGQSVRLAVDARAVLHVSITSDGCLRQSDPAVVPDVVLMIPGQRLPELWPVWRQHGTSGVIGLVRIEGDAALAQTVSQLARTLRWDFEEDMSRLVGDVAAVRMAQGARALAAGLRGTVGRLQANLGEYLGDESGFGFHTPELRTLESDLRTVKARLDALEGRLGRLEHTC